MTGRLRHDARALCGFLESRLVEDLARIWARDAIAVDPDRRPGMAAQVEVLDDLLRIVRSGDLPERRELRILLHGYGRHPDFDPVWQDLLRD